jgi:hypothetical protein
MMIGCAVATGLPDGDEIEASPKTVIGSGVDVEAVPAGLCFSGVWAICVGVASRERLARRSYG